MRISDIRIGTIVQFCSEGKIIIGTVVKMECGLYGILSEGVRGLYWRDKKALRRVLINFKRAWAFQGCSWKRNG